MINKKYISILTLLAVIGVLATSLPVYAKDGQNGLGQRVKDNKIRRPEAFGTVSAISGTTITVVRPGENERNDNGNKKQVTYTVDASKATVTKAGAASSLSAIVVGDKVMIQGTMSGTTVVADSIRVGLGLNEKTPKDANPIILGNGQPVVAGKITAINGNSITITNQGGAVYTIDVSKAKIMRGKDNLAVLDLVVGDSIVVQGAINGSSVAASLILDQTPKTATPGNGNQDDGFLGGIGGAFKNMFRIFGF